MWGYVDGVRYPDGGGLTARARTKREAVRREAAGTPADRHHHPDLAHPLSHNNDHNLQGR